MKALATILLLVVGTLVWALHALQSTRQERVAQRQSNEVVIFDFSNRWETTRRSLDELRGVNDGLQTNLTRRLLQLDALRREIADLHTDLARARAETRTAHSEITRRDARIQSLETRHTELSDRMTERQADLLRLEAQLAAAEHQLAAAEDDRRILLTKIERLQSERIECDRHLNDLATLRDQVRNLKQELTIARRLEWMRRDLYAPYARSIGAGSLAGSLADAEPGETSLGPGPDAGFHGPGEVSVVVSTNSPADPQ